MIQTQEEAFERVKKIAWESCGEGDYQENIHAHFWKYIESAFEISKRIGMSRELILSLKLSHLLRLVQFLYSEKYQVPEYIDCWLEEYLCQLPGRGRVHVCIAIQGYLLWFQLNLEERYSIIGDSNSVNPYEELIKFFEKGGMFTQEHDMLDWIMPGFKGGYQNLLNLRNKVLRQDT